MNQSPTYRRTSARSKTPNSENLGTAPGSGSSSSNSVFSRDPYDLFAPAMASVFSKDKRYKCRVCTKTYGAKHFSPAHQKEEAGNVCKECYGRSFVMHKCPNKDCLLPGKEYTPDELLAHKVLCDEQPGSRSRSRRSDPSSVSPHASRLTSSRLKLTAIKTGAQAFLQGALESSSANGKVPDASASAISSAAADTAPANDNAVVVAPVVPAPVVPAPPLPSSSPGTKLAPQQPAVALLFDCPHCGLKGLIAFELKIHLRKCGVNIPKFGCAKCKISFKSEKELARHTKKLHPENGKKKYMSFQLNDPTYFDQDIAVCEALNGEEAGDNVWDAPWGKTEERAKKAFETILFAPGGSLVDFTECNAKFYTNKVSAWKKSIATCYVKLELKEEKTLSKLNTRNRVVKACVEGSEQLQLWTVDVIKEMTAKLKKRKYAAAALEDDSDGDGDGDDDGGDDDDDDYGDENESAGGK